jgi:hypothetical protein
MVAFFKLKYGKSTSRDDRFVDVALTFASDLRVLGVVVERVVPELLESERLVRNRRTWRVVDQDDVDAVRLTRIGRGTEPVGRIADVLEALFGQRRTVHEGTDEFPRKIEREIHRLVIIGDDTIQDALVPNVFVLLLLGVLERTFADLHTNEVRSDCGDSGSARNAQSRRERRCESDCRGCRTASNGGNSVRAG